MSLGSGTLSRLASRLRPPRGVRRTPGLRVPMPDGVTLETDLYEPDTPGPHPTVLSRIPYGIKAFRPMAELYAGRGFNVVVQACRGTAGSGGAFEPLVAERADGLATLDWMRAQPWFDGRLAVSGPSYVGYASWAIADAPEIKAMSAKSTAADFRPIVFPGGGFHLGLWLSWIQVMEGLRGSALLFALQARFGIIEKRTATAASRIPLADADVVATGHKVAFWQNWLGRAIGNDAFWQPMDHRVRLGPQTPPNLFVSGWYDFMLDPMLDDYRTLVAAGHRPYLTIGPWAHTDLAMLSSGVMETLRWFETHLLGRTGLLRDKPVRVEVSGEWHEFDEWPPRDATDDTWFLHGSRVLSRNAPSPSASDRYRYDPADPTPNVGGAYFGFTGAGPQDQRQLEARNDVLTFTTAPLGAGLTVIGQPRATLSVRASLPFADLFVKLCDVDDAGRSIGIADGLVRLPAGTTADAAGIRRIEVPIHATGHRFARGHRLRLQVSSGAHPRFARNTGTDEPLGEATTLRPVDIEIFHDPDHPSTLTLPVWSAPQ